MNDPAPIDVPMLQERIRAFVQERDWAQFHTPKNLALSLMCEAAELGEVFQWLTDEESRDVMSDEKKAADVRDEIADVFVYVLRFVDVLGIDLQEAVERKLAQNARKYPVEIAKGSKEKYDALSKK